MLLLHAQHPPIDDDHPQYTACPVDQMLIHSSPDQTRSSLCAAHHQERQSQTKATTACRPPSLSGWLCPHSVHHGSIKTLARHGRQLRASDESDHPLCQAWFSRASESHQTDTVLPQHTQQYPPGQCLPVFADTNKYLAVTPAAAHRSQSCPAGCHLLFRKHALHSNPCPRADQSLSEQRAGMISVSQLHALALHSLK